MKDFYLKFTSREHAVKVLSELGFSHEDGLHHEKAALDEVGLIYKQGRMIKEDEYEQIPLQGFHINIRCWCPELSDKLGNLKEIQTPTTPSRVWF